MATILHFADSRVKGRGATVRLPSGEPCFLSIAQSSVLVKKSRFGFLGAVLYREPDIYKAAKTAIALAYLYPVDKTPADITDPVLRSFFNALLHCNYATDVCVILNEAVQHAEQQAGCALHEIPWEAIPTWAARGREQELTPPSVSSTAAPTEPSMKHLMLAMDKVAEEFLRTVGAIPSVKAANEYIRLPGYLNEPAMSAAFMIVALVASKKYETFFGSQIYGEFRSAAMDRMIIAVAEPYVSNLGQDGARRHAYSIVDQEFSRCQDAVREAIRNFIDENPHPLNPVFFVINNRLSLAYKQDAGGQFFPEDVEHNYRPIFTTLANVAAAVV